MNASDLPICGILRQAERAEVQSWVMGIVSLDHLVVGATDKWASAMFLAEMFDLPAPESYGPFAAVDVGPKPLKTKYPRSTTRSAGSGPRIGPQRLKVDAPVPWPMRSTAVPVPEEAAPLRLSDDAMRLAHPPGALREYDTAEPRTPLLER